MSVYFKVFNPNTGLHENANTLDEAKKMRQDLIDQWMEFKLQEAKSLHSITTVNVNDNGDELWSSIPTDQL